MKHRQTFLTLEPEKLLVGHFKSLAGQHPLQTIVLVLERFQLPGIRDIHAAKPGFVFAEPRVTDAVLPAQALGLHPGFYSLIIPMIRSPENLGFIVHPLLEQTTNTSFARFQKAGHIQCPVNLAQRFPGSRGRI